MVFFPESPTFHGQEGQDSEYSIFPQPGLNLTQASFSLGQHKGPLPPPKLFPTSLLLVPKSHY